MATLDKINGVLEKFGYQAVKVDKEQAAVEEVNMEEQPVIEENKEVVVDKAQEEAEKLVEIENALLAGKDEEILALKASLEEIKNNIALKDKEIEDKQKLLEDMKVQIEEVKKTTPAVESINKTKIVEKELTETEKKINVLRSLKN